MGSAQSHLVRFTLQAMYHGLVSIAGEGMKDYESKKFQKVCCEAISPKNGFKNMIRATAIHMDTFDMEEENVTVSQKQRNAGKY